MKKSIIFCRKVYESVDTCHEKTCTAKSRRPNFYPYFNEKSELVREFSARLEKMKDVKVLDATEVGYELQYLCISVCLQVIEEGLDDSDILCILPDESVDIRLKKLVVAGWEKDESCSTNSSRFVISSFN